MSPKEIKSYDSKDSRYDSWKKKNSPKVKRKYLDDTSSEDSDYSSVLSRYKKYQNSSCSSSLLENSNQNKMYVESNQKEVPQHIYGFYECKVCNLNMTSLSTYESHINGKKHMKALKAKNVVETVSKTLSVAEVENRYPIPPPGIHRIKVRKQALIQGIVEQLKTPCPGLQHVIEIRGLKETSYYCILCDSPCSTVTIVPHLQGFKHLLKCLKYFKPRVYKEISYEPKYKIERTVIHVLKRVEDKEGRGAMIVEKDFAFESDSYSKEDTSKRRADMMNNSYESYRAFPDDHDQSRIPNQSESEFYCKLCDASMNSEDMWESHIRGKRHLTNTRKKCFTLKYF